MKVYGFLGNLLSRSAKTFASKKKAPPESLFKKMYSDITYCVGKARSAVVDFVILTLKSILSLRKDTSKAAINNFRLGMMFLNKGKLSDAKLRFWLVDKFYPNSATNLYYLAYVNYLQGNIKKSLLYIRDALECKPLNIKRIVNLFERINKTSPELLNKSS